MSQRNNQAGVTLLEVMLSVAVIALLAGMAAPVYQSFQVRNDLDVAANTLAQTLRRAQLLSKIGVNEGAWGVFVQSGSITLFQGDTYAGRNTAYDEVWSVPNSISVSGVAEIVYTKFIGTTLTPGTITLTSSSNEVRLLEFTNYGTINY